MNTSEPARKRLRPEELAAVANALAVLVAPSLAMLFLQGDGPERAVAVAFPRGSGRLQMLEDGLARIAATTVPLIPFAALAAWRTHAIATGLRSGDGAVWRGIVEAVVVGALVPMVLLLRVVAERGVPGLAYASAYGVLGAIAGAVFGVVLTVIAIGVIRAAGRKRERERADTPLGTPAP